MTGQPTEENTVPIDLDRLHVCAVDVEHAREREIFEVPISSPSTTVIFRRGGPIEPWTYTGFLSMPAKGGGTKAFGADPGTEVGRSRIRLAILDYAKKECPSVVDAIVLGGDGGASRLPVSRVRITLKTCLWTFTRDTSSEADMHLDYGGTTKSFSRFDEATIRRLAERDLDDVTTQHILHEAVDGQRRSALDELLRGSALKDIRAAARRWVRQLRPEAPRT